MREEGDRVIDNGPTNTYDDFETLFMEIAQDIFSHIVSDDDAQPGQMYDIQVIVTKRDESQAMIAPAKAKEPPMVDIIDDRDRLTAIIELGTADKRLINISAKADSIRISSKNTQSSRASFRKIMMPSLVNPSSGKATYKNGVLEVRFSKDVEASNKRRYVFKPL